MTDDGTRTHNRWWGATQLPEGQVHHWRVGPADLWVEHLPGEWRVAVCRGEDPLDPSPRFERLAEAPALDELGEVTRWRHHRSGARHRPAVRAPGLNRQRG